MIIGFIIKLSNKLQPGINIASYHPLPEPFCAFSVLIIILSITGHALPFILLIIKLKIINVINTCRVSYPFITGIAQLQQAVRGYIFQIIYFQFFLWFKPFFTIKLVLFCFFMIIYSGCGINILIVIIHFIPAILLILISFLIDNSIDAPSQH